MSANVGGSANEYGGKGWVGWGGGGEEPELYWAALRGGSAIELTQHLIQAKMSVG